MTRPSAPSGVEGPLNKTISRVGQELLDLLSGVDKKALEAHDRGGVLTVAIGALPGLIANMAINLYEKAGVMPPTFVPARRLPPGWDTVLQVVEENTVIAVNASTSAREHAYNEGVAYAAARVKETIRAAGTDTGVEPLNLQIARKAIELQSLLDQVTLPSDELPGGGVLALAKFSMDSVARNMNEGLYIAFGLLPRVDNPAYLPSKDWKSVLEKIRKPSVVAVETETNEEKYQYHEGVRWTCAKFRSAFQHLSEPAQYR
jgi:hypothetical protein